ncbi:MAG: translation elongation factor 4, partial [Candidatus Saccharibacteria bacterium]|nr:translation elongation factor 4 [Candidatus Saccharibacteria bacterium]
MKLEKIRNFCIVAHIDHGKSTLADRMMEITGTVEKREMKAQLLDSMELEREKGITIKLAPVQMHYKGYELNLIDTPGHVDFSYEVSRSLQAVEAAVVVVDATQGIQAQTLANVYLALEQDLFLIPVINKIDLPAAETEKVAKELINLLGVKREDIIEVSAKTGLNVEKVLDAIIERAPAPEVPVETEDSSKTRALIFDSYFDDYRGVILYVRLFNGEIKSGEEIRMLGTETNGQALEVGVLKPKMEKKASLGEGEVGYIVTNLKSTGEARVGDTVTLRKTPARTALPGYRHVLPFVYAGFFPVSNEDYKTLKEAVEKLALSDSALQFEPENSPMLGFGLRIGFLGLLHLDIIQERLEREFGLELVVTSPSTSYQVKMNSGKEILIKSAVDLPDPSEILEIREPWARGEIIVPRDMIGNVLDLIVRKRGEYKNISYIEGRAVIDFLAPMANLLTDFYDQLKTVTSGYATFNYEIDEFRAEDLVRVDFLVAGEKIDALAIMCHKTESEKIGREMTAKLKKIIPRQNFEVAIQAAIGAKIIARETIGAYRKDVTVKIHTGDRDRKAKLLEKQKKGKARLKKFGKVEIPGDAFKVIG